jgi:hypothetical protein
MEYQKKCTCMWNDCGRIGRLKLRLDGEVIGRYCAEHATHMKNFLNEQYGKIPPAEQRVFPCVNVPSNEHEVVSHFD